MSNILVLYYSSYGHIEIMARAQARAPRGCPAPKCRSAGAGADSPDIAPLRDITSINRRRSPSPKNSPVTMPSYLERRPLRNMASQMRNFLDRTDAVVQQRLVGKIAVSFAAPPVNMADKKRPSPLFTPPCSTTA